MTSAIQAEANATREDKIDAACRDRAYSLANVLWDSGARPGDAIGEEAWGEAEAAALLDHTSERTRLYAVELMRCRAEGREHSSWPGGLTTSGRVIGIERPGWIAPCAS